MQNLKLSQGDIERILLAFQFQLVADEALFNNKSAKKTHKKQTIKDMKEILDLMRYVAQSIVGQGYHGWDKTIADYEKIVGKMK